MRVWFRCRWRMPACALGALLVLSAAVRAEAQAGDDPAPPFVVDAWDIEEGLPQNSVNVLLRGRSGYLWIGTQGGLARFDGIRFTVYTRVTTPRLPHNRVTSLHEDPQGTLWVGTLGGGLTALHPDGRTDVFTTRDGLPSNVVSVTLVARDGTVWVGTDAGLVRRVGARFVREASIPAEPVRALYEDRRGRLWVSHGLRLDRLGPAPWGVDLPRPSELQYEGPDGAVALLEGPDGTFWGLNRVSGLWRLTGRGIELLPLQRRSGHVWNTLDVDARGRLLITGSAGAVVYDPRGETRVLTRADGLRSDRVTAGLFDPDGSLWLGLNEAGLQRLRVPAFRVHALPGPHPGVTVSVAQDRAGDVWTANACDGIVRLRGEVAERIVLEGVPNVCATSVMVDREDRVWVGTLGYGVFVRPPGRARFAAVEGPLVAPDVTALYEDRAGALWVGTLQGATRLFGTRATHYTTATGLPGASVRGFVEGRDGTVYVATDGGVGRLRRGTLPPLTVRQGLASNDVRALYEDASGALWIGTYGSGLHRYRGGQLRHVTSADGLSEDVVSAILEDAEGRFWMSGNRGITRVARADLNAVADGRSRRVRSYLFARETGIPNAETSGGYQPAAWKGADGRLWFPTFSGAAVVDPARLGATPPPATAVEAVRTDAQTWTAAAPVVLPLGERRFDVVYTGLDLSGARQTRFRYRLRRDDRDTAWVDVDTRRVAYFTNVAPGRYTFEVAASGPSGLWTPEPAALALDVPPYPFERAWVQVLVLLGFVGGVAGAVRVRLRRAHRRSERLEGAVKARTHELREQTAHAEAAQRAAEELRRLADVHRSTVEAQAAELEAVNAAQSRFFANLSHEFRTPLTLIIGPIEVTAQELRAAGDTTAADELETTLRSARRLLRLIDQLLDLARLESRALPFRRVEADLAAFVRDIAQGFVSLASHRGIVLDVHTPDSPLRLAFDVDALEKIVFNLLANALKFTPTGGRIGVRVGTARREGRPVATFAVRDSGIGIAAADLPHLFERFYQAQPQHARTGAGIGLALVRELVDLHGGHIEVESEVGFGSTFTVTLPMAPAEGRLTPDMPPVETPHGTADGAAGRVDGAGTAIGLPAYLVSPDAGNAPGVAPEAPSRVSASRPLVLVVEDHDDVRAFTRRHLESIARVIEARDGNDGLRIAFEHRPDLVITDVTMPGLDGIGLCQQLKADPRTALTPVLLLTARAAPESRVSGLDAGADDYLVKPFVVRELQARVENLLRLRLQLREAYGRTVTMAPTGVHLSSADEQFVTRVREVIEAHLGDSTFDIPALAEHVGVSLSQLHRRIKAMTGQPPVQLLRSMRLARAADLLAQRVGSVAEVAFSVGFNSLSYFARCFREQFGVTPSEYAAHRESRTEALRTPASTAAEPPGDAPIA